MECQQDVQTHILFKGNQVQPKSIAFELKQTEIEPKSLKVIWGHEPISQIQPKSVAGKFNSAI